MTLIGYTMMCEQAGPKQLVHDVVLAEQAGFDFAVISDHYFPWLDSQGHSPYAWSVLGAAAQATDHIPLMTSHRAMRSVRTDLEARLREIDGVISSESMFGNGEAYWVNGKEIAHFERDDVIEVRLTRQVIRERRPAFKGDDRVQLRPSGADWITVRLDSRDDVGFLVELVKIAAHAHQPPLGQAAKPPPVGEAMRRRQRFH